MYFRYSSRINYRYPIMTTNLTVQAGIRMSDIFIDKMANRDDMLTVEPRVNVDYNILNRRNNNVFDDFSVVGGYGVAAKAPDFASVISWIKLILM